MGQLLQLAYPAESEEEVEGQSQAHHSHHCDRVGGTVKLSKHADDKTGQGSKSVVEVVDALDTASQSVGSEGLYQGTITDPEGSLAKTDEGYC